MSSALKPIPGFEGLYGITQDGRIWSHPKVHPHVKLKHGGKWMKAAKNGTIRLSNRGKISVVSPKTLAKKVWE